VRSPARGCGDDGKARSRAHIGGPHGRPIAGCWRLDGEIRLQGRLPISTTLLEAAPQSERIAQAGREAFAAWGAVIARALVRDGFSKAAARRLSTLAVSAVEGALILSRVEASAAPIEEVAKSLGAILKTDTALRKRAG